MSTSMTKSEPNAAMLERVLMAGDLSKISAADRLLYYRRVCDSLGLNPLTQPFAYITLNSKLILYAKKDATDQLRRLHNISLAITHESAEGDIYSVRVKATDKDGRTDEDMGAVSIANLKGETLVNARLKAVTKAKRRTTLSICGLGWLDESEVDAIPSAVPANVDPETGEVLQRPASLPTSQPAAPSPAVIAATPTASAPASGVRKDPTPSILDHFTALQWTAARIKMWLHNFTGKDRVEDLTQEEQESVLHELEGLLTSGLGHLREAPV